MKGKPFAWDRGVDYEKMYRKILRHYKEAKRDTQKAYDIILLTQLRNGSRITEAIEFLKQICEPKTFTRKKEVRVLKVRNREVKRLMVLPKEIDKKELFRLSYIIKEAYKQKVVNYARRTYGINTHSLRYAFITHLARKGIAPQLIAKITGHQKLDFILHYTQQVKAEQILENVDEL